MRFYQKQPARDRSMNISREKLMGGSRTAGARSPNKSGLMPPIRPGEDTDVCRIRRRRAILFASLIGTLNPRQGSDCGTEEIMAGSSATWGCKRKRNPPVEDCGGWVRGY